MDPQGEMDRYKGDKKGVYIYRSKRMKQRELEIKVWGP